MTIIRRSPVYDYIRGAFQRNKRVVSWKMCCYFLVSYGRTARVAHCTPVRYETEADRIPRLTSLRNCRICLDSGTSSFKSEITSLMQGGGYEGTSFCGT
jgi:hypothetical protein